MVPNMGLPACAPCFGGLTALWLGGYSLPAFPPGILIMPRLEVFGLYNKCCFERLPEWLSGLTALKEVTLGRHAADSMQIGGVMDAQALGSLACFAVWSVQGLATANVNAYRCPVALRLRPACNQWIYLICMLLSVLEVCDRSACIVDTGGWQRPV